ncbi:MAG TPA: Crp/Fnr family transcriptional regulator, partial [Candidatus Acidoferrum sp.]|nr:Crp/Fnr family transcriptional regulator [Candidatus Acidoferrum sp.]
MDKVAYLRQVPIFGMLEPTHLALVAEMMHPRHYRKDQIIFYRGDPGDAMYILVTGSAKMTLPSETGSDVFVALLRAGDHFGELAVLDGRPRYVTVVAAEATELLAIYRENLLAFMKQHAEVSLQVAISLCLRLRHITELLADMAFLGLLPRIAKRLCQLAGHESAGTEQSQEIRVSQEALAEMVGASREAVNKQLARLREMGLIETGRGRVRILGPERLRAIAFASVTD